LAAADSEGRATFADVLRIGEFRALYVAQTLSYIGDQLARIAVAVLIYARTGSALFTGLSYAVSYLPWVVGGPILSVYADRFSHRSVMLVADLIRAATVAAIALPGLPLALLLCLVAGVALFEPPFSAARAALIPEVVSGEARYTAASTLGNTTNQLAVVVGFAIGGAMTSGVGAHWTVFVDAATFVASALVTARFVGRRPPAISARGSWPGEVREGVGVVFGNSYLRWLVLTSWVIVGTVIASEAAAVPYAHAHGGGAVTAGLLSASLPTGITLGALILGRSIAPETSQRLIAPLALLTPLVLALTWFNPRPVLGGALWLAAGGLSAMTVVANRVFVLAVPRAARGRAFGVAVAGIAGAQGIGTLVVGSLASHLGAARAVGAVSLPAFALVAALAIVGRPYLRNGQVVEQQAVVGAELTAAPTTSNPSGPNSPSQQMPAS
jgi:MFS family permease